jgi:hypothetical protein
MPGGGMHFGGGMPGDGMHFGSGMPGGRNVHRPERVRPRWKPLCRRALRQLAKSETLPRLEKTTQEDAQMTDDQNLFQDRHPTFTDADARKFYDTSGQFVSVDGRRVGLDSFAIQFATNFRMHGPFVMNATTARALCRILIENDFGPVQEPRPSEEKE